MTDDYCVIGLGFGDEGKGTVVDALTRRLTLEGKSVTIVRFNGGPQAAHNVVLPDGVEHTYQQFGSGTHWGASTHLSRYMLVNPSNWLRERMALLDSCMLRNPTKVSIDPCTPIITPYHQMANTLRERARGADAHGSCGQGVGELMGEITRHGDFPLTVPWAYARSSRDVDILTAKLLKSYNLTLRDCVTMIRSRKLAELIQDDIPIDDEHLDYFSDPYILTDFISDCDRFEEFVEIKSDDALVDDTLIYEGAQGVLLDEDWGFHPHTTWSKTTCNNALDIQWHLSRPRPLVIGVTRAYSTRHGAGPFPTEGYVQGHNEKHNGTGLLQGPFRAGAWDVPLARYSRRANANDVSRQKGQAGPPSLFSEIETALDAVAVTHLDIAPQFASVEYAAPAGLQAPHLLATPPPLSEQEKLTKELSQPFELDISYRSPEEQAAFIRKTLDDRGIMEINSWGPSWEDKDLILRRRSEGS